MSENSAAMAVQADFHRQRGGIGRCGRKRSADKENPDEALRPAEEREEAPAADAAPLRATTRAKLKRADAYGTRLCSAGVKDAAGCELHWHKSRAWVCHSRLAIM